MPSRGKVPDSIVEEMRRRKRTSLSRTHSLTARDIVLLEDLTEYLGCSRSEVVRTGIRTLAVLLTTQQGYKPPK